MSAQYFAPRPAGELATRPFSFTFRGREHRWLGAAAVFSSSALDQGTRALMDAVLDAGVPRGAVLLDLGCGSGLLGLVCRSERPDLRVVLSDINLHATSCAKLNADRLGFEDAAVLRSDGTGAFRPASFDVVALNPPIRAGLPTVLALLRGASAVLRPGGTLYMVVRVKQGAKRLARLALEWFEAAEDVARESGYLVYRLGPPRRREG